MVLLIEKAGNVGIGTTSPGDRLEVRGGKLLVNTLASGAQYGWIYSNDTNHSIIIRGDRAGTAADYTNYYQYGGTLASGLGHKFWTGGVLASQTLKMQIADNGIYMVGNLGINTTSPSYKLDVAGDIRVGGEGNSLYFDTSGDSASIRMRTINSFVFSIANARGTASEMRLGNTNIQFFTNNSERFTIFSTGNVGIGTTSDPAYKLRVQGQIYASDDIIAYSDARAKENVVTVDGALNKVTNLRGVYYTRKDDETKKKNVGVIAQEVLEVVLIL
jgi:hypothetical protein